MLFIPAGVYDTVPPDATGTTWAKEHSARLRRPLTFGARDGLRLR